MTTLSSGHHVEGLEYGDVLKAKISGIFGDFLKALGRRMNFTFSLHKPGDGKWGGRSTGRKTGWNGMVGDIAEGLVDFGIGPFTISAARSEVIQFSIGNIGYVKTFFLSTNPKKSFNFSLFTKPLSFGFWIAVVLIMFISALVMFIIIKSVNDEQSMEFDLRKSFTFSITGISFIRRWTVTPSSISGRIVFITILLTGVVTQGIWKASFTSGLAIRKNPPLRPFPTTSLEDLLEAGVTLGVAASSSGEGNFRESKSGPFQTAWTKMKNNSQSLKAESRKEAIPIILADDHFAYFDSLIGMAGTKEYQACLLSAISSK